VGNGNILQGDVELGGTEGEVVADAVRDSLSLSNEFCSVELGDDSLEDFVTNGGEDSLIVVGTEVLQELACCLDPMCCSDGLTW
jgi:hypothetical protein